jgi:hypothetical protein
MFGLIVMHFILIPHGGILLTGSSEHERFSHQLGLATKSAGW